jgi:hypothetical protein
LDNHMSVGFTYLDANGGVGRCKVNRIIDDIC